MSRTAQPTFSLALRDGRYYVAWWEDGRAHRVSCRTALQAEARRFLAEFEAARAAPLIPSSPTVGAIVDGYEADRLPHVASATLGYACQALRRVLGDLPADLLTKERVRHYGAQRRRERSDLSNGTIIRELVTLRAALRWAMHEGWITSEPRIEVPPAPPPRNRWLTAHEAYRLLDSAGSPHVRLFIVLALHTGARRGAILELTWDQVDLEHGRIALGVGQGNKRRAVVPINSVLREELEKALELRTSNRVVEFRGAGVADVKTGFIAAVKRAGLTNVTPHTLRHTAASWMAQDGQPMSAIAGFLGDAEATVQRVYAKHHPDYLKGAAEALAKRARGTKTMESKG